MTPLQLYFIVVVGIFLILLILLKNKLKQEILQKIQKYTNNGKKGNSLTPLILKIRDTLQNSEVTAPEIVRALGSIVGLLLVLYVFNRLINEVLQQVNSTAFGTSGAIMKAPLIGLALFGIANIVFRMINRNI